MYEAEDYELSGALCLFFTNTVGGTRHGAAREYLHDYADLLHFSETAGLIDSDQHQMLLEQAHRHPEDAQVVFERAISLREALFRIFEAASLGKAPQKEDLDLLNQELSSGLSRSRINLNAGHYGWGWSDENLSLDQMLGPLARSAADLLTSGDLEHVRECGGDSCSWLFVDRTRNHSRVWCDMKSCGNRAKVRRHRLRSKA